MRKITEIQLTMALMALIGSLTSSSLIDKLAESKTIATDSKRIIDIRQLQNALELYRLDNDFYPIPNFGQKIYLGQNNNVLCLKDTDKIGFYETTHDCVATYMARTPEDPSGDLLNDYTYQALNDGQSYQLEFKLDEPLGDFDCTSTKCTVTPD